MAKKTGRVRVVKVPPSLFAFDRKYGCPAWVLGGLTTAKAKREASAEYRAYMQAYWRGRA